MQPPINDKGSPISASTSDIMLVQETMLSHGLYNGEIDGIAGKQTLQAVRSYKRRYKMPQNNALSEDFIAHLRDA